MVEARPKPYSHGIQSTLLDTKGITQLVGNLADDPHGSTRAQIDNILTDKRDENLQKSNASQHINEQT